jgi:hypothetical protein
MVVTEGKCLECIEIQVFFHDLGVTPKVQGG